MNEDFKRLYALASEKARAMETKWREWRKSELCYTAITSGVFTRFYFTAQYFKCADIKAVYEKVHKQNAENYKVLAELCLILCDLSSLCGGAKQETFVNLFYECRDDLYNRFGLNQEAARYIFEVLD